MIYLKQVKCDNLNNQSENQEWKKERLQIAKLKIDSEQLKLFTCKKTESENEWSESDEIPDIYSGSEWKKKIETGCFCTLK